MTNQHISQMKGSRRVTFKTEAEELQAALDSPQYWWWRYLRMSKDYWWVCKQHGNTLDKDLKALWRDFGDVYRFNFDYWWRQKGRDFLLEQVKLPDVKRIDEYLDNVSPNREKYLIVEIPLNLSERTITRKVLKLLREEKSRKIERKSSAKRQLAKLKGIRTDIFKKSFEVWAAYQLVKLAKKNGSAIGAPFNKLTTHQIGVGFELVRNCMPKLGEGVLKGRAKRNGMKVAVSRLVSKADALIANAEIGKFPCYDKVSPRKRWTDQQQQELDAAVARGEWTLPDIDVEYFRSMFLKVPELPTIYKMDIDASYYQQSNIGHRSDG